MAKYSEDFSVATWDKNSGFCTVTANATTAHDSRPGRRKLDHVDRSAADRRAGVSGQYTFHVWAEGCIQHPEGVHRHR
jgi:hypothetical protein